MIDWESIKKVLTEEQFKILHMFLEEKQSIRNITQAVGMGRTKVGNIIQACTGITDELDKEIELRKLNLRTHRNAEDVSEFKLTPLTDEEMSFAYTEIVEGDKVTIFCLLSDINEIETLFKPKRSFLGRK